MAKQDSLDLPTRELVRFAAAIAQGDEPDMRERVRAVRLAQVPVVWVEELLLQSILMCGYPRALVAMSVWRKFSGVKAPPLDRRGLVRGALRVDEAGRGHLRHRLRRQLPEAARQRAGAASRPSTSG